MINIGGLVLYKILSNPTNPESLEAWSKLKLNFFAAEYISIYSAMNNFYNKYSTLPSFNDLDIILREGLLRNNLKALQKLKEPDDVSIDKVVDALLNEYTQEETLKQIEVFIDSITLLDSEEIKQELSNIVMTLEEKTHTSEKVCLMNNITITDEEELLTTQVPLGISNTFDSTTRAKTSELLMIGGKRGSGKSIVVNNIFVNQYLQGNSCLYFSIEMNQQEIFNRTMSILSKVNISSLRNSNLNSSDYDKLALCRKNMFMEADDLYEEYIKDKNYKKFESRLIKEKQLKIDNQLIIVDNQRLTLADIDLNTQKFKSKFGDKLKLVVVDYMNQIEIEDIYSWQQQIVLAKQLKNFARKYDVVMVTPYQIDASGEARFSKGILDSPDTAMILEAHEDHLKFKSSKVRSGPAFEIASPIDWDTLSIDACDYITNEENNENNPDEDLAF